MTTMVGRVMLDTNIVLRLVNTDNPHHDVIRKYIAIMREDGRELWINRQIIREYLVQITRPGFLINPQSSSEADTHVERLQNMFQVADDTHDVTEQLRKLLKEFPSGGKQIHDANIVATMLVNQIGTIVTLNFDDLKRFIPLIQIVSPLTET